MTREEILRMYNVDTNGIIRTPGKFEGEMLYTPDFWESGLDGAWSEDVDNVYFFQIDAEDRVRFPELGEAYGLALSESDTGFVSATILETKEKYDMALEDCQKAESEQEEMQ
jgi:hypothetical protein